MIAGSHPFTVYAMYLAKMVNPNFSATDLFANKTTAAPSVVYDEFPAVVVPPFLNAGLSFANYSMVDTLIPSSFSTKKSFIFPSLSLT